MKLRKTRRGFTIVELVIVVAVIGVLAAVLIPTFINLTQKANKAADNSLVANLNTALAGREGEADDTKNNTMQDVIDDLEAWGYKLENLTTKSKEKLLWNEKTNRFTLEDKADFTKYSTSNYWKIVKSTSELLKEEGQYYSGYAHAKFSETEANAGITVYAGFDVGTTNISAVTYENKTDSTKVVSIRTTNGSLNIGSSEFKAKGQVYHYGIAKDCTIYTETSCFHTAGGIGNMDLKEGKAIAEDGGLVYLVKAAVGVLIEEVGTGKFFIPEETTQAEDGTGVPASVAEQVGITPATTGQSSTYSGATKVGGNVYEIGNLAALEKFRDLVNGGFSFDGISVKLTNDITLSDGWTPIGEGSRKAAINTTVGSEGWKYSGNVYKGEFDGNNHKIYNLNNKGYVPTTKSLGEDGTNFIYCYGLFSIVAGNAYIHDLELVDVDINTSRYASSGDKIKGDSVAALVGFSAGSLHLDHITVSGTSSIVGYEAASSILARAYKQDSTVSTATIIINNCSSNATVNILHESYAAGMFGYIATEQIPDTTITNNTFTGTVSTYPANSRVPTLNNAGLVVLSTNTTNTSFTHYGNVNSGTQIGGNNAEIDKCLFLKMSTNTFIEASRNVDNVPPSNN